MGSAFQYESKNNGFIMVIKSQYNLSVDFEEDKENGQNLYLKLEIFNNVLPAAIGATQVVNQLQLLLWTSATLQMTTSQQSSLIFRIQGIWKGCHPGCGFPTFER